MQPLPISVGIQLSRDGSAMPVDEIERAKVLSTKALVEVAWGEGAFHKPSTWNMGPRLGDRPKTQGHRR